MTRIIRILPALALVLAFVTPASAQSQQQLDDLRRRVEDVERQLFQARLNPPISSQSGSVERLQQRLEQLEREIASERISRVAASISSPKTAPKTPAEKTLETRVSELEAQREADAKVIAALVKRIEALEKPAAKPRIIK
jgi:predicted nuclease with TOPRIM domain